MTGSEEPGVQRHSQRLSARPGLAEQTPASVSPPLRGKDKDIARCCLLFPEAEFLKDSPCSPQFEKGTKTTHKAL